MADGDPLGGERVGGDLGLGGADVGHEAALPDVGEPGHHHGGDGGFDGGELPELVLGVLQEQEVLGDLLHVRAETSVEAVLDGVDPGGVLVAADLAEGAVLQELDLPGGPVEGPEGLLVLVGADDEVDQLGVEVVPLVEAGELLHVVRQCGVDDVPGGGDPGEDGLLLGIEGIGALLGDL